MSSPLTLPLTSFSLSSSATASPAVELVSAKQMLWQAAVYLVVVLGAVIRCVIFRPSLTLPLLTVIVAIIASVILLIWNDSWTALIRQCLALKILRPESAFIHSPGRSFTVDRSSAPNVF